MEQQFDCRHCHRRVAAEEFRPTTALCAECHGLLKENLIAHLATRNGWEIRPVMETFAGDLDGRSLQRRAKPPQSKQERHRLKLRNLGRCQICGKPPWKKGHKVLALCKTCSEKRSAIRRRMAEKKKRQQRSDAA